MDTSTEIAYVESLLPLLGIVFLIGVGVVVLYLQFQQGLLRQKLEHEETKNQHQRELMETSIRIQENERKRIAQDLHDELSAALSASQMRLQVIEDTLSRGEAANLGIEIKEITEVKKIIGQTMVSARRISHELMPIQLVTLGWKDAIRSLIERTQQAGKLEADFILSEKDMALTWAQQTGLYRIYAELMNNTLRHADATAFTLQIEVDDTGLSCAYSDNGKGFSDAGEHHESGLGLRGVAGRIEALGGVFTIDNGEKNGILAAFTLPLKRAESSQK